MLTRKNLNDIGYLSSLIVNVVAHRLDRNRTGCVVCVKVARTRKELETIEPSYHKLFTAQGRENAPGKPEGWFIYSREKPERTTTHEGHVSSHQSRNPDAKQYGGAIVLRVGEWWVAISVSGFNEETDEAGSMVIAHCLGWLDHGSKAAIDLARGPAGNTAFLPLLRIVAPSEAAAYA